MRLGIELGIAAVCVIATAVMLMTPAGRELPVYALYITAVLGIYLAARFLGALLRTSRIVPGEASRGQRQFFIDRVGFSFGPMDVDGSMIETKWREVDRAYIDGDVLYLLCMNRRHWAAMDKKLVQEGSWEELLAILRENVPARKIVGG